MMERTLEELMGRKVTTEEHDDMRRIFDEAGEPHRGGKPRDKVKAKAARKSRKKNRR